MSNENQTATLESTFDVELLPGIDGRSDSKNNMSSYRGSLGLHYLFGDNTEEDPALSIVVDESKIHALHSSNSSIMTVFLLLNTMIGSGILNQPAVFQTAGVVSATIMLVVTACFTWLGLVALIDTGVKYGKFDYSELSLFAFGKHGETLVDICIAIGNFGALLSYMIVIGSTATDLFDSWGCLGQSFGCSQYLYTPLIVSIFVTPVCCKRVFGELAFYSVISMISIGSIVGLTVIAGPIVGSHSGDIVLSQGEGLLSQLGSIIFALSCAFASFHTFISLHGGSAVLWRKVTAVAMVLGTIMLFVIGICTYLCPFMTFQDLNRIPLFVTIILFIALTL